MSRPLIPCPYCRKALSSTVQGVWPFCTERCKALDLGAWAKEEYRVPAAKDHEISSDLESQLKDDYDSSES